MRKPAPPCQAARATGIAWRLIPRQQCGQFGDLVIGDPGEHIGEPRLRIDTVELSRENDRKHDRGALSGVIKRAISFGLNLHGPGYDILRSPLCFSDYIASRVAC